MADTRAKAIRRFIRIYTYPALKRIMEGVRWRFFFPRSVQSKRRKTGEAMEDRAHRAKNQPRSDAVGDNRRRPRARSRSGRHGEGVVNLAAFDAVSAYFLLRMPTR